MPDLKTQLGDYFDHVIERVGIEDVREARPGIVPLQPIQPRRPMDGRVRWAYAAAAAVVVLLLVGGVAWLARSSLPEPIGPATTSAAPTTTSATQEATSTSAGALSTTTTIAEQAAATTTSAPPTTTTTSEPTTTTSERTTTTVGSSAPTQIDLEINVTVFFDPEVIAGPAQAEAALRTIVGDADVDSITIMDRTEAWAEAQALAARTSSPLALDPALPASLGEVARIVVLEREVRNRLTDAIEDSPGCVWRRLRRWDPTRIEQTDAGDTTDRLEDTRLLLAAHRLARTCHFRSRDA